MSGHSKWSTIKRKKGANDAKRGKLFTKLIKEITVSARMGGGDPDANPRLRLAIDRAKTANMPGDNIERAVKKGTGDLEGVNYEECLYEGYGPAGVAVMVEAMTDNKNRTTPEIKKAFSKFGGNLGESGCVAWQFAKRGLISVDAAAVKSDQLMEIALEAGADDINEEDGEIEIVTGTDTFDQVVAALKAADISLLAADVSLVPQNSVEVTGNDAKQMLKLMEFLEDHDDVQNVYANFDIDSQLMEEQG